jgi:hypothetical protein
MTFSEEQVEWIVVEVIRRLGLLTSDNGSNTEANGELKLIERVVTMQVVESRLDGVQRVMVRQQAIVTPAVKDELKRRKIELVYHKQ